MRPINFTTCGGFIIAEHWVISAAHCPYKDSEPKVFSIKVIAGIDDLTQDGFITEVDFYEIHEQYKSTLMLDGDICILRTEDAFPFSKRIQAAVLPPADTTIDSLDELMVTGNGITNDFNWRSEFRLKRLDLVRVERSACIAEFRKYYAPRLYETSFCTASTAVEWKKQSTCFGDSGGPAYFKNGSDRSFVVYGVVVGGTRTCSGMNLIVFLPAYLDWIRDIIERNPIRTSQI